MFIIFDLDDTLIDTSRVITPIKLKQALEAMQKEGCFIPDFQEALGQLLALNEKAESAKDALKEFVFLRKAAEKFFLLGIDVVYSPLEENFSVSPTEGAIDLLSYLCGEHNLAIVSIGKEAQQLFKMKKAGIDSRFFYKIILSEERDKKKHYQQLMKEWGVTASEVIVCGDRILLDLLPAKELGCTTVHIKQGRGVHSKGPPGSVDFTIENLVEFTDVLGRIGRKTIV